jgi:hypothetical protein
MSYSDGEALALAIVRQVSPFSAANTAQGKWNILNQGKSRLYAILKPGEFERSRQAPRMVQNTWTTIIEVWARYVDDGTTLATLEAAVAGLLSKLDAYPHLGDASVVAMAFAKSGSVVQEMWKKGGGPVWLRQDITVAWLEQVTTTVLE